MPTTYTHSELADLIEGADIETISVILWLLNDEKKRYTLYELESLNKMIRVEMGLMVGCLLREMANNFFKNMPKG